MTIELITQRINAAACNGKEDVRREMLELREAITAKRDRVHDLLINQAAFTQHKEYCMTGLWSGRGCVCGLERLEAEIREVLK